MRVLGVAAALVLGLAAVVQAEPLNLKQVPADAKWVAHMDVDAIRASTVAQKAYKQCHDKCEDADEKLAKLREKLGMDPTTDLHGITFYGTQIKKEKGVVIVQAEVDQKHLVAKAKKAPDYSSSKHKSYKLHTWTHRKGKEHEHSVTGCFHKPTVIVFGRTADEVTAALDVLDGKSPALAGSDSQLAAEIPAGTVLLARAVGLADADLPSKSPLAKECESLCLAIGEHDGEVFAKGKLVTKSEDVAKQLKEVAEGFRALGALKHAGDADAVKILDSFKVTVDGKAVAIEMQAGADAVWEHAQKMREKMREKMGDKDWKSHWKKHREKHREKHGKKKHKESDE